MVSSPLVFLPGLCLKVGVAMAAGAARFAPVDAAPMLAKFADDEAAFAGAVAADGLPLGFAGPGAIVVRGPPGLADRLRMAGAGWVIAADGAVGCGVRRFGLSSGLYAVSPR